MRRRTEPASPKPEDTKPAEGYDWTTQDRPGGPSHAGITTPEAIAASRVAPLTRDAKTIADAHVRLRTTAAGDARNVDDGDSITVEIGRETYSPVKYNTFDVGPLTMTTKIRNGESAADAYVRARVVLEQIHEAELDQRIHEFIDHLDETRKRVRNEP